MHCWQLQSLGEWLWAPLHSQLNPFGVPRMMGLTLYVYLCSLGAISNYPPSLLNANFYDSENSQTKSCLWDNTNVNEVQACTLTESESSPTRLDAMAKMLGE